MKRAVSAVIENKVFWIIVSLFAAIGLWFWVLTTANPVRTAEMLFTIEYTGDSVLESYNLRRGADCPTVVRVNVKGGATDLAALRKAENAVLTVDLTTITEPSESVPVQFELAYQAINPSALIVETLDGGGNYINVSVIRVSQQHYDIDDLSGINYSVAVSDQKDIEYIGGQPTSETTSVTIEGPEEAISQIASLELAYTVEEPLVETTIVQAQYILRDELGQELSLLDMPDVSISPAAVTVIIPVRMVKEVPVKANLNYAAGATANNTTVTVTPETVRISGEGEILAEIDEITTARISLNSFMTASVQNVELQLPASVELFESEREARVNVQIRGLSTLEVTTGNIIAVNLEPGYEVDILSEEVTLTLRGPESILAEIDPEQVMVQVDLTEYKDNTGNLEVSSLLVSITGYEEDQVGALKGDATVLVAIREKAGG